MVRYGQIHATAQERRRSFSKSLKGRTEHQRRAPAYTWDSSAPAVHNLHKGNSDPKHDRLSIIAQVEPSAWSLDIQVPFAETQKRGKRAGKSVKSRSASLKQPGNQFDLLGGLDDGLHGLGIRNGLGLDNFTPATKSDFQVPQCDFTFSAEGLKHRRKPHVHHTFEGTESRWTQTNEQAEAKSTGLWQHDSKRSFDMTAPIDIPSRKRNEPRFFPMSAFLTKPEQAMVPKRSTPATTATEKLTAAHLAAASAAFHALRRPSPIPTPSTMTLGTHCNTLPVGQPPTLELPDDQPECEDLRAVLAAEKKHVLKEAFEPFLPDGRGGIYRGGYSSPGGGIDISPADLNTGHEQHLYTNPSPDPPSTPGLWQAYQTPEDHARELHFDDLFAELSPPSTPGTVSDGEIPSLVDKEEEAGENNGDDGGDSELSASWCNISDCGSDIESLGVEILEYDGDDEWVQCE